MKFTLIKIKQQKIEVVLKPPPLSVFTACNESFVNLFLKTSENNKAWIVAWIYVGPKKSPLQKKVLKVLCSVVNDLKQGFQQLVEKIENIHYIGRDHLYPCIITRLI